MVHKYIIFYEGGDDEAAELCEVCAGGLDCEEVGIGEVCEECGATNDED